MREIGVVLIRRIAFAIPVILGITLYLFFILEFSPADPRYAALGMYASEEQRDKLAKDFHLDDPLTVRYGRFVKNLATGNLGVSIYGSKPVTQILAEKLPVTLSIAVFSIAGALVIAFALGVTSAYFAGSWWDSLVRAFSFGSLSIPMFWLGLLLIQIFSLHWRWLPAGGYVELNESMIGWARSLVLPSVSLALPVGGFLTRVVRSSVLDELDRDYVRTARGGGLSDREIIWRNVLKNALISPLTVIGLQAGYILSGAVLVEVVFALPGLGNTMLQVSQQGDIGVILGIALIAALFFVVINLLVDIAYVLLNPRARES